MASLSQDLRERIIRAWEEGRHNKLEIAHRFDVSESFVKKLIAQKKRLGHVRSLHHRVGRKPKINADEQEQLLWLIKQEPGITLYEMRERLNLSCSIQAVHRALQRMGVVFKKGRYAAANRVVKTFVKSEANGSDKAKPNGARSTFCE
ncbi:MAG: hypothetical protein FWC38_09310 [Proteobacteria bacterium]|nr:hypothetical protein [Pseudomonadota bacterium]